MQELYELSSQAGEKIFSEIPGYCKSYEYTYDTTAHIGNSGLKIIDTDTAGLLNYHMKEGKWLTDDSLPDDKLLVVATSKTSYRVGDELTVKYYNKDGEQVSKKAVLAGITREAGYFSMIKTVGGSYIQGTEDSVSGVYYEPDMKNDNAFMCLKSSVEKHLSDMPDIYNPHRFVRIAEYRTDADRRKTEEYLQENFFFYLNMDTVCDNLHKENQKEVFSGYAFIGCFLFIVILGIGGFIMLNTMKNKRMYSIYYMTGMKWRDIAVINFIHSALICFVSLVIETGIIFINSFIQKTEYIRSDYYKMLLKEGFSKKIHFTDFISADVRIFAMIFLFFLVLCFVSVILSVGIIKSDSLDLSVEEE